MAKGLIILVGVALIVVLGVVIVGSVNSGNDARTQMSQQETERIRLQEQALTQRVMEQEKTIQQLQQLKSEDTARTTNLLALIFGTILAIGTVFAFIIFLNDRMERNRVNTYSKLMEYERMRIKELEMRQIELAHHARLERPTQTWYLTGNYDEKQEEPKMIVYNQKEW